MSRVPLSLTGLGPLLPQTQDNPFVEGEEQESPALSIARYSGRAPREQQEALGRALYATTGLVPEPASERERNQIRQLELMDRTRIAKAAADPRNPISQDALNSIVEQHNQRWSMYGFLSSMPSPASLYAEKAAEQDPDLLAARVGPLLEKYRQSETGNDELYSLSSSQYLTDPQRDMIKDRMAAIDAERKDTKSTQEKRGKAISATLSDMLKVKGTKEDLRTHYDGLRLQYPDLPQVAPDASFDDYRRALLGQANLPSAPPAPPGVLSRFGKEMLDPFDISEVFSGPADATAEPAAQTFDLRTMNEEEAGRVLEIIKQGGRRRSIVTRTGKTIVIDPNDIP